MAQKKFVYNEIKEKNIIMSSEQRDKDDFYDLYDKNEVNHLKSDDFYGQIKRNTNEEKSYNPNNGINNDNNNNAILV